MQWSLENVKVLPLSSKNIVGLNLMSNIPSCFNLLIFGLGIQFGVRNSITSSKDSLYALNFYYVSVLTNCQVILSSTHAILCF